MWSGQPKEGSSQTPNTLQGVETVQSLGKAWDTISQTKAALRHIENKLEAAPTSTVVCDSVMSSKKSSASATRKISRKDGRYLEDSSGTVSAGKSCNRGKIRKEKSSRSPLRVTTFDSNVKKGNRVEFRDPLASYRETYSASSYLSASQLEAKALLDGVGVECAKAEADIHKVPNRDIQDFDSTRSSAIDNTVVRYLNDRPAIDALQSSEHVLTGTCQNRMEDVRVISGSWVPDMDWTDSRATMKESELRGFNMTEMPQSPASSASSQRLEILRRRQPDAKLEKLKERIRKQWEHSEEAGIRNVPLTHSEQPVLVHSTESAASSAKVRKVAMAPPAPAYKGFNPTETKIRTPDGKVWPEAEFHNISRELYRDLALKDGTTTKEKGTDKSKEKKTARPVRKVQKVARGLSPDVKQGRGHAIGTSSWREGQKLVKKILGPPPKLEHGGRIESNDRGSRERISRSARPTASTEADAQPSTSGKGRPQSFEHIQNNMNSNRSQIQLEQKLTAEKEVEEHLNKDFLPKEIRGILDDLQLESGRQGEKLEGANPCNKSGRSKSPIKRKPDKGVAAEEPQVTSKKRHYDSEQMRQYILRQQEERKKKQNEERTAQKEAREQKAKRLEELYKKQKEAFAKSRSMSVHEPSPVSRLHETYTKLTLEQTWLKEQTQMGQPRPVYQPSGESDKENKGQERPLSASSSSDLSLSEPPQPLGRSDLVDSTWMLPDRLSPRSAVTLPPTSRILLQPPQSERVPLHPPRGPVNSDGGNLFSHRLTLENMAFLQKEGAPVLFTNGQIPTSAGRSLNLPLQTCTPSMDSRPDPMAKPTTSQYQRKLDRIEALKATAASLSNRVESEARQLACGSVNYSTGWNTKLDLLRPSEPEDCWAKPVSPPVRDRHEDAFSARIKKMLDTCVTHGTFDTDLPGVGNLHEYRKLPQAIRPFSAAASLATRSFGGHRDEELSNQQSQKLVEPLIQDLAHDSPEHKAGLSHNSSAGSLSEGPLPSEGSLSEGDEIPLERSPPNLTDALQSKEFCTMSQDILYGTMKEFRKEVEHFQPLPLYSGSTAHSKGPWAELAKGSPHSVINIYTKSYPYGNGGEDQSETKSSVFQPLLPSTSFQDSVSYDDDFSQSSVTLSEGLLPVEPSGGSSVSSVVEELPSRGSPSQRSQSGQTGLSSRRSASSKKRYKAESK